MRNTSNLGATRKAYTKVLPVSASSKKLGRLQEREEAEEPQPLSVQHVCQSEGQTICDVLEPSDYAEVKQVWRTHDTAVKAWRDVMGVVEVECSGP